MKFVSDRQRKKVMLLLLDEKGDMQTGKTIPDWLKEKENWLIGHHKRRTEKRLAGIRAEYEYGMAHGDSGNADFISTWHPETGSKVVELLANEKTRVKEALEMLRKQYPRYYESARS